MGLLHPQQTAFQMALRSRALLGLLIEPVLFSLLQLLWRSQLLSVATFDCKFRSVEGRLGCKWDRCTGRRRNLSLK
jgi:hypothetical protein